MKFQSLKTSKLNKKKTRQILALKDTHWTFGNKSQVNWFKKKIYKNDIHSLMLLKGDIVGYTFLGKRTGIIYNLKKKSKRINYTLFETLILKKKYRNIVYASRMMRFNLKTIFKLRRPSFLLCKNNKLNFYKYFGWTKLSKKYFLLPDHKSNLNGLIYNFKHNKKNKYKFYTRH